MSEQKKDTTEAIDRAIAAAKQRSAAKGTSTAKSANEATKKRTKLTDEEKAARQVAKEAERAAKKAARDAAREQKKLEREQNRKPAHMSKVQKAGEKLPTLSDSAQEVFDNITANFGRDQVAAIALHLQHFNRVKATERALEQKLADGDTVRIVGGDLRFIGQTATVTKAQRIRCYVEVPGFKKPVYLFTSDVEVIEPVAKTGTEG